ncbi:J domain-containing protein [Bauldia sp.]|uniref:J domain-containing protein n=1 Tax=Bauldia sp. TaxID=2575872 RepID=UPI003BAC7AF1
MDLNSKYFDRIRIKPESEKRAESEPSSTCEWEGCNKPGGYRAPKGRGREGEYHNFCLEHVRAYNKSYNYFAGMADDDIADYQRSATFGHRPTWNVGVNRGAEAGAKPNWSESFIDPFGVFGGAFRRSKDSEPEPESRTIGNFARRSFEVLDLEGTEPADAIKARYKELVKRHHPDANGGDRSLEDRLREIIQAYNYLKSAGFCS